MKKVISISVSLFLSFSCLADGFLTDLSRNPRLLVKPFLKTKLKLGEIPAPDCDCDVTTSPSSPEAEFSKEAIGSGRALRGFLSKLHEKQKENSKRKLTFEIITPVFRKGKDPQLRSIISPIDLSQTISKIHGPIKSYSDKDLEFQIILNNPKLSTETNKDYAIRIHAAMTALKASIIGQGNPDEALRYIQARMKGKSFRHKIHFLSQMLGRMNDNYDKTLPSGEVSTKSLYKEMHKDNMGTGAGKQNVAGVCRHMHQLALKMARKMGLKMSYGISYATHRGYHLNTIISNPLNPSETVRFNYSSIEATTGAEGSGALAQSQEVPLNSGITYHVWDDNDTPLYYLPNQKGLVLERMSGGDIRLFDPNISPDAGITRASYQINDHQVSIFHALNPEVGEGEHIMGASYYTEVPISKHFSAEWGGSLYYSRNEIVTYDASNDQTNGIRFSDTYQTTGLYMRGAIKGEKDLTKRLKFKSQFLLRATGYFATKAGKVQAFTDGAETYSSQDDNQWVFLGDGSGSIISDLVFTRNPDSQSKVQLDISGQIGDITANTDASLYVRRLTFFHDETFRFGKGNGSLLVNSSLNVVPLNDGVTPVIFSTSATYRNSSKTRDVSIGYIGSLNPKETPYFISGARPTISAGVTQSLFDGRFSFGLNLAFSPEITMTGVREVSELAPGGNTIQDAYIYQPGGAATRAIDPSTQHLDESEQRNATVKTERYQVDIPYQIYGGIFLRGSF